MRKLVEKIITKNPGVAELAKTAISSSLVSKNAIFQKYIFNKYKEKNENIETILPAVYIEATLTCNASCIMCNHGYEKMAGEMDMDLFRKIADDCKSWGITSVGLNIYGEPLADRHLFERLVYLQKLDIGYGFFSNAILLDKAKARKMFEIGGLTKVNFSVNAYSSDVYEKVTGTNYRDRTYQNITDFLALKKEFGREDLCVGVSFVKLYANKTDRKDFIKYWKAKEGIDYVVTSDLWKRVGNQDISDLGVVGKLHREGVWHPPCNSLWKNLCIYYDGKVAPCCDNADIRNLFVGDMKSQTLKEVWVGKKFQNLREMHLADNREKHKVCGKCSHNYYL